MFISKIHLLTFSFNFHSVAVDAELANFDNKMIRRLAFQRLQQIATKHTAGGLDSKSADNLLDILKKEQTNYSILPSEVMLSKEQLERIAREFGNDIEIDDMKPPSSFTLKSKEKYLRTKVRCRAVLAPVSDILRGQRWFTDTTLTCNKAIPMPYRSLTIGTGVAVDLNLNQYGQCCHVSTKHAIIFYDNVTKYFELINYSEFGSEVNGQIYSCNLKEVRKWGNKLFLISSKI